VLIVLVLLIAVLKGMGPMNASPYTKAALNKRFSENFNSSIIPNSGTSTIQGIVAANPNVIANILVYPYFAYQDLQAGKINQKQFFEVMNNTRGSVDYATNLINTNYALVVKNDPKGKEDIGLCYVHTNSDGSWNANTINYIDNCKKLSDIATQVYQSSDPNQIYQLIQQYAVLLEQNTFYFSANDQYGLDATINVQNFNPNWLLNNTRFSLNSVQKTVLFKGNLNNIPTSTN